MKKTFVRTFLICLLFLFYSPPVNADWINLSGAENAPNIAEIHIEDDHVRIKLEIFVDDMVTFDRLIPDTFFEGTSIKRPPLAKRLRLFSDQDFQIITDKGRKLQAELKLIEPRFREERPSPWAGKINPYTLRLIPGPPEDKRVLYAELVYSFKKKPTSLTIIPPLDEQYKISKVPIGFVTYHNGVPVNDFKFLSGPSTVRLDWADPWYSKFDQKALKRWQRGGVMAFLYIEPYEVRHEILARVKDLTAWIDLGLRGNEFIEADENEALKKRVGGLHIGLVIFFLAGSILLYPLLKVAVAKPSVMAPKMTDKEAVSVLDSLLKNIYRSFDFREEEDVYDRLATSVSGDLLSEIYLQNRKSLVVTQAGGARARVKEVEILNVDVNHLDHRPLGLLFRAKWTAMGSVGHWGHIHIRKNQYEANITVEPVDGAWKITGLELLEEKRIDSYAKPKV